MTDQDKNKNMIEGVKEKLKVLSTDPKTIDDVAKIFWAAENEEDVRLMQERLRCYPRQYMGCKIFLYSHFDRLLEIKPEILEEAKQKLGKLGRRLSPTFVEEFFDMCCDLHPKYDAYSQEFRDFSKAAYQFALNEIKEYLGVEINTPVKRSPLYNIMYHIVGKIISLPSEKGPFIGEIKEKSISRQPDFPINIILDCVFHTDESNQNNPGWNIRVEDKKGEIDLFSYTFRGNSLETMVALDKEFNIGDRVRIERYSNGGYSYPVRPTDNQPAR